ncbi:glycosyltransferase [Curtobacterium sp. MCBD17_028]|uniref:glycosyltransferase n=1 Tax=Curtobacterium sp. MCBD17_028 TaxID=2175670 RepID=UPI000DA81C63|nr:glycosyltransferase [Curtobacterium sp. MCBD17_028]PZE29916.1 hypothetical protein DEI86_01110 [Curtobacterium sp. MCBD17_028]
MPGLIVHEWIGRSGGSEKVLDAFARMYPDADVFCLWNEAPDRFAAGRVTESLLARTPLRGRKALALPAMPAVWRRLRAEGYDWVLSSSHAFSHQVVAHSAVPADRHFAYVHTPARYVWTPEFDGRGNGLASRIAAVPLRVTDRRRAAAHRNIAANSAFVQGRIRDTWGKDSRVIHPPVEVADLQAVSDWRALLDDDERRVLDALPAGYVLGASRFIPYKRLDLVIAAGEAAGRPVVLGGGGPEQAALEAHAAAARVPVRFVLDPSDRLLRAVMAQAAVYVFPAVEDFGIMPVEAMALGVPVVVGPTGGATESVVDGVTGAVASGLGAHELAAAVDRAVTVDPDACRRRARDFGAERFADEVRDWMLPVLAGGTAAALVTAGSGVPIAAAATSAPAWSVTRHGVTAVARDEPADTASAPLRPGARRSEHDLDDEPLLAVPVPGRGPRTGRRGRRSPVGARIVVNGAFRTQRVTGQQRYATEIADRLSGLPDVRETAAGTGGDRPIAAWARAQSAGVGRSADEYLLTLTSRGPALAARHVVVVHDLFVLDHPEWFSRRYVATHAPVLRTQLRSAALVVAVSEPIAGRVRALLGPGTPVVTVPNAPADPFRPGLPVPESAGAREAAGRYVLAVGSDDPRKNTARLVAAHAALPEALRTTHPLVMVGGGSAIYARTDADDRGALRLGYVDDAELARLYAHAALVAFPSLDEGFGLPAVEAFAAGSDVLVSDVPALRWVCGDDATYVDPTSTDAIRDGLAAALTGPTPADERARRAATIRDRFSWDRSATLLHDAVTRLVRAGGAA